jgi:hypothetical protein
LTLIGQVDYPLVMDIVFNLSPAIQASSQNNLATAPTSHDYFVVRSKGGHS